MIFCLEWCFLCAEHLFNIWESNQTKPLYKPLSSSLYVLIKYCTCLYYGLNILQHNRIPTSFTEHVCFCFTGTKFSNSSTLAWKIPWMEEPGRRQSMGSLRVGHDWATSLSLFTFMHWRRKWQPTPVFFPGESQGQGSLLGCHLWGRTESDTTEAK